MKHYEHSMREGRDPIMQYAQNVQVMTEGERKRETRNEALLGILIVILVAVTWYVAGN